VQKMNSFRNSKMIFKHMSGGNAFVDKYNSSQFTHSIFSYELFGNIALAYKSKLGRMGYTMSTCFSKHYLTGEIV